MMKVTERMMQWTCPCITVLHLLFFSSGVYAIGPWQDYDGNCPVGFAAMDAPTGGAGGPTVEVRTVDELKHYCSESPEPLIIHIMNDLDGNTEYFNLVNTTGSDANDICAALAKSVGGIPEIRMQSNKTVVGIGRDIDLFRIQFRVRNVENIIFRNLTIAGTHIEGCGANDSFGGYSFVMEADRVWIDHCFIHSHGDGSVEYPRDPGQGMISFTWCRFANQIKGFRSRNGRVTYDHCFFDGRDLSGDPELTREFSAEYMDLGFTRRIPNIDNTTHIMNCYYLECGVERGEDLRNHRGYCVRNQGGTGRVDNTVFEKCKNPFREDGDRKGSLGEFNCKYIDCQIEGEENDPYLARPYGTNWVPPYEFRVDPLESIPAIVMAYAGPGKGPFAPLKQEQR